MIASILLSLVFMTPPAAGGSSLPCAAPRQPRVAVVMGDWKAEYDTALQGLRETLGAEINVYDFKRSSDRIPAVIRVLLESKPNLIIAFGTSAYKILMKRVDDIPVMFSMVSFPEQVCRDGEVPFGVSLQPDPCMGIECVKSVWGRNTVVGIIYDPRLARDLLERYKKAAEKAGVKIRAVPAREEKESYKAINVLKDEVDLFILVPDSAIANKKVFEHLKLECFRRSKPIIGCSRVYLVRDCLASVGPDYRAIGRATGERATAYLKKKWYPGIVYVKAAEICINEKIADRLNVRFPESVRKKAVIIK